MSGLSPINVEARKYLREWLDIRPDVSSESLFVSQLGETLTTRSVQRLVADIGHLAKIAELTPHVLRHTFAKKLAENKVSIDRIATLLGHSSVDTTGGFMGAQPKPKGFAIVVESENADALPNHQRRARVHDNLIHPV